MNILYGVPGEGMGHATRSKEIIRHLLSRGHNIHIVSSARAFAFLNKEFPGRVTEIKGLHFAFKDAAVSKSGTFWLNLKSAPASLRFNFLKKKLIEQSFSPQLVITDFESFSYAFARLHQLPLISIDNMQVMDRCALEINIDASEKNNYRLARGIVKAKVPGCEHYFISSFFDAPVIRKNTTVVPPIIRQAIQQAKPLNGKHILVYQTSSSLKNLQFVLQQLPHETFFVYGMNRNAAENNVVYKPFSEAGFIQDLASAKAVIANGGFSFISEAVYLKKPVYSFPVKGQFEQWMNAAYIQHLGYGRHFNSPGSDSLKAFLYDLPVFEKNLQSYSQHGNRLLFEKLDEILSTIPVK